MIQRRKPHTPEALRSITAKTLKVKQAEEHLLRRLGAALVLLWDETSDETQDRIIDQAVLINDDGEPATASEYETLIRRLQVK